MWWCTANNKKTSAENLRWQQCLCSRRVLASNCGVRVARRGPERNWKSKNGKVSRLCRYAEAKTMKALRKMQAARGLSMETAQVPAIGPTDVLVRVKTAS